MDYIPVLQWVYHVRNIDLGAVNKMPAKTFVRPEAGYIPLAAQRTADEMLKELAEKEYLEEKKRAEEERRKKIEEYKPKISFDPNKPLTEQFEQRRRANGNGKD